MNRANIPFDLFDYQYNEFNSKRAEKKRPASLSSVKDLEFIRIAQEQEEKKKNNFILASLAIAKFRQHVNARRLSKKGTINRGAFAASAPSSPMSSPSLLTHSMSCENALDCRGECRKRR